MYQRVRTAGLVVILGLAAACTAGGSEVGRDAPPSDDLVDDDTAPVGTTIATATTSTPAASSTTTSVAPSETRPAEPLTARTALSWLPSVELDDNESGPRGRVSTGSADWAAIADHAGLAIPSADAVAAAPDGPDSAYRRWFFDAAFADGGGFYLATGIPLGATDAQSELIELFGFGHADMNATAWLFTNRSGGPGVFFDSLRGAVSPGGELVGGVDGVWSLGEGEDYERNVDQITVVQPFGAPLRVSTDDGLTAVTESTDLLTQWIEGGERLIDRPAYDAIGTAFGDMELLEFWTLEADFSLARQQETDSIPIDLSYASVVPAPFTVVAGLVSRQPDGELVVHVGYVFNDAGTATSMVEPLRVLWNDPLTASWLSLEDTAVVETVSSTGRVAVIQLSIVPETGRTNEVFRWVALSEPPFIHL